MCLCIPAGGGYQLVGDNVDVRTRPRYMTTSHSSTDYHWFHVYAVKHRVSRGVCMHGVNQCIYDIEFYVAAAKYI